MALHTATDMFAHSTAIGNNRITHPNADDYNYVHNRYVCAKLMAVQLLQHAFKVINFAACAQEIASYYYSTHSSVFDAMSCTIQN